MGVISMGRHRHLWLSSHNNVSSKAQILSATVFPGENLLQSNGAHPALLWEEQGNWKCWICRNFTRRVYWGIIRWNDFYATSKQLIHESFPQVARHIDNVMARTNNFRNYSMHPFSSLSITASQNWVTNIELEEAAMCSATKHGAVLETLNILFNGGCQQI